MLLCSLAIVLLVHMTMLLNSLHTISHIWTPFPLTYPAPAGTESGVVTVGLKPSVTLANGSREVYIRPCSSSSLLYWPNDKQWTIQPLFSESEASVFMDKIRSLSVVSLEKGCSTSKPLNRLATLEDGTKVCCRILHIGNIYSYHLNWLLGLRNVPPITAVRLDLRSERWKSVHDGAKAARWYEGMRIIMEPFIDNLTEVYNLPYFNDNETSILTVPVAEKLPLTPLARKMMVQWSDMILFDFLIGHTDRIFSNHYAKHLVDGQPVKNLYKTPSSKLILIDNDSAFTHGYTGGIYFKTPKDYEMMCAYLRRTCAFRQHTIEGILSLERHSNDSGSPLTVLQNYIKEKDPYTYSVTPTWQKRMKNIEKNMRDRIEEIKSRLLECKSHVVQCH